MLVYYFVPFIVSNRYLLFWVSNGHNSVTVQNRTHVYMNFFDNKDLGNHLLQLCPKVVKHPVYICIIFRVHVFQADCKSFHYPTSSRYTNMAFVFVNIQGFIVLKNRPIFTLSNADMLLNSMLLCLVLCKVKEYFIIFNFSFYCQQSMLGWNGFFLHFADCKCLLYIHDLK